MIQLDARVIGHIVKDGHRLITHGRQRSVPADAAPDAKRGRRERLAGADGIGEVVPGHDQPLLVDCDGDASLANKPLAANLNTPLFRGVSFDLPCERTSTLLIFPLKYALATDACMSLSRNPIS